MDLLLKLKSRSFYYQTTEFFLIFVYEIFSDSFTPFLDISKSGYNTFAGAIWNQTRELVNMSVNEL